MGYNADDKDYQRRESMKRIIEIFKVALVLGLTSFGGPVAHLGYFHKEYVERRKWIDDKDYADLVALCQFLPGPASSQVGIGIGTMRGGVLGGMVAWLGFTLPSALALLAFAMFYDAFDLKGNPAIHGLKVVSVAIVAHAVWSMGKKLVIDKKTAIIAILSASVVLLVPSATIQVFVIIAAAISGVFLFKGEPKAVSDKAERTHHPTIAIGALVLLVALFVFLPYLAMYFEGTSSGVFFDLIDGFYRSGSLVFGGGHVVLPLLELETVPTGLVDKDAFIAGYGAAQAVPGPLFTFASFLGAEAAGPIGALVSIVAIFAPAFLLVIGVMPFWNRLRQSDSVRSALVAVNASVIGILMAALYHPIFTSSVINTKDAVLAMILYGLLGFLNLPSWLVVIAGAMGGWLFAFLP